MRVQTARREKEKKNPNKTSRPAGYCDRLSLSGGVQCAVFRSSVAKDARAARAAPHRPRGSSEKLRRINRTRSTVLTANARHARPEDRARHV